MLDLTKKKCYNLNKSKSYKIHMATNRENSQQIQDQYILQSRENVSNRPSIFSFIRQIPGQFIWSVTKYPIITAPKEIYLAQPPYIKSDKWYFKTLAFPYNLSVKIISTELKAIAYSVYAGVTGALVYSIARSVSSFSVHFNARRWDNAPVDKFNDTVYQFSNKINIFSPIGRLINNSPESLRNIFEGLWIEKTNIFHLNFTTLSTTIFNLAAEHSHADFSPYQVKLTHTLPTLINMAPQSFVDIAYRLNHSEHIFAYSILGLAVIGFSAKAVERLRTRKSRNEARLAEQRRQDALGQQRQEPVNQRPEDRTPPAPEPTHAPEADAIQHQVENAIANGSDIAALTQLFQTILGVQ